MFILIQDGTKTTLTLKILRYIGASALQNDKKYIIKYVTFSKRAKVFGTEN